jgi:flagellar hook protein FlgE
VLVSSEPTGGTATLAPSAGIALAIPPAGSTLADGAAALAVNWNLVDTSGSPTITQTAMASGTTTTGTNGFASGTLSGYAVQPDGTIEGTFSSGKSLALGQVVVANFANAQGLSSTGNNNYQPTAASGAAVVGLAGTGGRGTIIGGNVELSNVNIATEFARLIVAQQAYSANAKSITTFSTISQATLAMIQ